jgi:Tol biopolymer transport system component
VLVLAGVGSAAAWSPGTGGAIAFDRIDSTDPDTGAFHAAIWITTAHGRVRRLVGRRMISAIDPAWAPDGRAVAFARDCSFKYALTCSSVWRMNANGSGLRKLSDGEAQDYCPAWSPDGARIAFTAEFTGVSRGNSGIYVMDVDGRSRTAVDKNELDGCPDWSPDGSRLAFWRANGIFSIRSDGTDEHQIASGVGHDDAEPDWSPDGTRIAFSKSMATGHLVCVIRTDGTGFRSLARGDSPAWSPSGRRIAFARDGEIYTVAAAGGRPVRVTSRRMYTAGRPAWRPG